MLYLVIRWIRLLGFTRYTTSKLRSYAMLGPHTSYLTKRSDLGLYFRCRLDSHLVSVCLSVCPSPNDQKIFSVRLFYTLFGACKSPATPILQQVGCSIFFLSPPIMSEKYAQDKPRRVNTQARATH